METDKIPTILPAKVVSNMKLFCDVAQENGATVSLKDLIALNSLDFSEEELEKSWDCYTELSSRYRVASGVVLENITGAREWSNIEDSTATRIERANSNIAHALQFGALLEHGFSFKVLSISGSTSYLSVSETDDLDFFCVAKTGTMWHSFVSALILARAFRAVRRNSPWLCLSYVSDEDFVRREFSENKNALYARDAIATRVVHGEEYYLELLKENSWMSIYFPKLYSLRVEEKSTAREIGRRDSETRSLHRILNLFLYCTAGTYIKIKSYLLNRKFSRDGKFSSLFKLRIGVDHCIYESADYVRLRELYAGLDKKDYSTSQL